ncbi:hypothetical protein SUGI_0239810 [Cryptomeria japonica]|nr:hypothetical protein SUGI_0239810 [Cryptomeria japonica]
MDRGSAQKARESLDLVFSMSCAGKPPPSTNILLLPLNPRNIKVHRAGDRTAHKTVQFFFTTIVRCTKELVTMEI